MNRNAIIALLLVLLATGCATCRESSDAQATRTTDKTPAWQQFFGWLFGCAGSWAYDCARDEQRIQSSDFTR